jgi:hypothetical protein
VIEYRTAHPFRTVEELARVKGIGPKTVRRLRPHLTVRGETTAGAAAAAATGATGPPPAEAQPPPAEAQPPPARSQPSQASAPSWRGPVCPSYCRCP